MSSIKDGVDPAPEAQEAPRDPSAAPDIVVSHPSFQNGVHSDDAGEGSNGHASQEDQGELQIAGPILLSINAPPQSNPASSLGRRTEGSSTNVPPSEKKSPSLSAPSKPQSSRKKRSFWSRLFSALVPCVGHSQSHNTEEASRVVATTAPPPPEKQRPVVVTHEEGQEKSVTHEHEPSPISMHDNDTRGPIVITASDPPADSQPTTSGTNNLVVPHSVPAIPNTEDGVVVPPPSPKRLSKEITGGVTSGAVQAPGSTGHEERERVDGESEQSESSSFTDEEADREILSPQPHPPDDEFEDEEERLIMNGGAGIPIGPDGMPRPLLPPIASHHQGRKCLVLDLDETLVHSSFKLIPQADYVVPVEIEWQWHNVYVIKRPGVDNFLKQMGELYEIVVFTASLSKYADPVLDKLDIHKVVSHRLFRESCYNHKGNYVKDLSQLGRNPTDTIILDNSPASYIFHPNNAVPVSSWFNDPHDTELTDLVPFLTDLRLTDDVRGVLDGGL
ncbi:hypothetical protein Clacol_000752 [Clathrus columnatus]|uniref:FCP1 homology domain-containing protein n=1 Tax=Clathrus columnatus TaxID=1419009 RepID=A0AAV4ZZV7_9AGAM|nr:hypothetical protein Clacol_000752 [Clathrus columnatus]